MKEGTTVNDASNVVKRYENNPILTPADVPYPANLVFNAGITKYKDRYVMIFRNDYGYDGVKRFAGTNLGIAFSDDGLKWTVEPEPFIRLEQVKTEEIGRIYDPRLTVIEDELYMCFAVDTKHGVRGGIARISEDLKSMEVLSICVPENRNMVLFPEKVGGMYIRLERPMPVYSFGKDKFDIWMSKSPDLKFWGESELVLGVEHVPYADNKIGPAAPPIKTKKGWLTTFHAVDVDETRGKNGWEPRWTKRYTAGIMLLDLNDPSKVIGMCKKPLLLPTAPYEADGGFRNNTIFPGGMVLEDNGEVKIYYGAADAVECVAIAHVDDLLALCTEAR